MRAACIVLAKAPVAGLAKTRLAPALGAAGAAHLAHRLLLHTAATVAQLHSPHLELCVSPDTDHPAFAQAAAQTQGRLQLSVQGDGDLGQRMHRALARVLHTHSRALLLGTDAPALDAALLRQADAALDAHDAVFVPAADGGYALVGLRRPAPELFEGMVWSTPRVMADTRLRAHQAGLRWAELACVHDIDEPADLVHLPPGWV